ncbi:MAG: sulfatase [Desulfofustis sp.]|nr:sulfatase [Desulfofustis sp.]
MNWKRNMKHLTRSVLMESSLTALCSVCVCAQAAETEKSSASLNIVFILADDMGWTDLGCYGNPFIETPNIDALAARGMRFTAAYTASVCTPSRGMILSGQYSARTGLYKVPFPGNDRPWAKVVPPANWGDSPVNGSKPVGAVLATGGYTSKIIGKVHVPSAFVEGLNGNTDESLAARTLGRKFYDRVVAFSNDNPGKEVGTITKQAVEFIASNSNRPFFCYVGHHAPHIPLVARQELTQKYEEKYRSRTTDIHPHYAAMCEALDESVGLILETLDRLDISNNTMVVFFSDNGGVRRCFYDGKGEQITDLTPLRGEKGGIYEGGIRVPLIVRWPGTVRPGSTCDTPVVSTDFLPTFAAVAGIDLPPGQVVDGISLEPLLKGQEGPKRERIFTYFPDYHHDFPGSAVREGDYKLIESAEDGHLELYNLADDIGEQKNLAAAMPEKAAGLKAKLDVWLTAMGAKEATINPRYELKKQDLLDPAAEDQRKSYLPPPCPLRDDKPTSTGPSRGSSPTKPAGEDLSDFELKLNDLEKPGNDMLRAYHYGPGWTEPFPVEKDTFFRVDNLRSGSIKTEKGWSVQDFAHSFFNPNPDSITISLKMVSDDPGFVFSNDQVGTYTKSYHLKPMFGVTDNVFICPVFEKYSPDWPVSAGTNFTGSVEFSSPMPFYYYMLHPTPVCEAEDMPDAYFAAWNPCTYDEAGVWDPDLNQFIIPYTNYWHNTDPWAVGWYSTLVLKNNTDQIVNYTLRHIPFYGVQYNNENGWITRFTEQIVVLPVKGKEEKKFTLMELFRWSTTQTTGMEGCLLISPDIDNARQSGTSLNLLIFPNESGKPLHPALH